MTNAARAPTGELSLRTVAMPADTNPAGDIFGGWRWMRRASRGGCRGRGESPCGRWPLRCIYRRSRNIQPQAISSRRGMRGRL